jgi:hypothetical protein
MSLQTQQMGRSVGAMNVSLLGAEGASRVVRVMVFSTDMTHLLSTPVDDEVCDTGRCIALDMPDGVGEASPKISC